MFQFVGRRMDAETGLYYFRARYYSPTIGRFLQNDPIGTQGGLHLYAYVGNDPLNLQDPMGTNAESSTNTPPQGGGSQMSQPTSWTYAGQVEEGKTLTVTGGDQVKIVASSVGLFPLAQTFSVDITNYGTLDNGNGTVSIVPNAGPPGCCAQNFSGAASIAISPSRVFSADVQSPTGVNVWSVYRGRATEDFVEGDAAADVNVNVYINSLSNKKVVP